MLQHSNRRTGQQARPNDDERSPPVPPGTVPSRRTREPAVPGPNAQAAADPILPAETPCLACRVVADTDGRFRADTQVGPDGVLTPDAFLTEDGSDLDIAALPPGCWPVLYKASPEGRFLYFSYFLSPVLHRWTLDAQNRRQAGGSATADELIAALARMEGDGPGAEDSRRLRSKITDGNVVLTGAAHEPCTRGGATLFFALERLVARLEAGLDVHVVDHLADIAAAAADAGADLALLTSLMTVPPGYTGPVTLVDPVAEHTLHWSADATARSPFRRDVAAIADILAALNGGIAEHRDRFRLGPFIDAHPVWFAVRTRGGGQGSTTTRELCLSRQVFGRDPDHNGRVKHALHRMQPHLLRILHDAGRPIELTFNCTDEATECGDAISFDAPAGADRPLVPDLYVLEHVVRHPHVADSEHRCFLDQFMAKRPVLFWRGTTTGGIAGGTMEGLAANPRVRACLHVKHAIGPERADVKIARIHDMQPHLVGDARRYLAQHGILAGEVPPHTFGDYRTYLDLGGNGAAWGSFHKYLLGCLVIRPRHGRELLYYRFQRDGVHFIEADRDMANLPAILQWIAEHPAKAAAIAYAGRELMLDYLRKVPAHFRAAGLGAPGSVRSGTLSFNPQT